MKNHQETLNPTSITPASFRDLLSRYPSHLSPKVPKELETIRMVELPATLSKRVSASEDAADEDDGQGVYLTKDELARLMEWKLYAWPPFLLFLYRLWQRYAKQVTLTRKHVENTGPFVQNYYSLLKVI